MKKYFLLISCFLSVTSYLMSTPLKEEISKNFKKQLFLEFPQPPSFDDLNSQLCTYNQIINPKYDFWVIEIGETKRNHRKQWEFCYILESLKKLGMLSIGKKGLGFGVGTEPLPAVFVKYGCYVTATDQDEKEAIKSGWKSAKNNQFAGGLEKLYRHELCDRKIFENHCEFLSVDMNEIPSHLSNYDFLWSSCALEHLGDLQKGFDFIFNSLKCLKNDGIAIHTTEFNLSSNVFTIKKGGSVIYRKKDIETLIARLTEEGHTVFPLNLNPGETVYDNFIDTPPYKSDCHLKLLLQGYESTSLALIIKKGNK